MFFDIVDQDINATVGILFTVGSHVAYEVYDEFRNQGIATQALKYITSKINRPVLEIKYNNMASKAVALNAGYKLNRVEHPFEIYEYKENNDRKAK